MTNTSRGNTYEAAHGRWREILIALGLPEKSLNRKCQPCPLCGGEDRFQFTDRGGEGEFICRGCGAGKGMLLLMKHRGWDFRQAAREVDAVIGNLPSTNHVQIRTAAALTTNDLRRLWGKGELITAKSAAGRYLISRGLREPFSGSLRFIPSLRHAPTNQNLPCMIARFADPEGAGKQIHRTYLTEDGRKAEVEPCRMFMPGQLPKGGAIRLGEAHETIGIAEGIETALSARWLHRLNVWATCTAGLLEQWVPPNNAKRILVFGDNDDSHTGQAAAHALAKRLLIEAKRDGIEREVDVMLPPKKGNDWNDVLTNS